MTLANLNQIKTAVRNLSPRERIALREYLEEFKDFEELNNVVAEFRSMLPTADWEEMVSNVNTAIAETRHAKADRRVRYQRVRERSHRKARTTRPSH